MNVHDLKSAPRSQAQPLPPKPRNPMPVWVAATLAMLWLIVWDL